MVLALTLLAMVLCLVLAVTAWWRSR